VKNNATGALEEKLVRKELHHANGNRGKPGFDEPFHLREVWPWEHAAIDGSRHTGYTFIRFLSK
jgi:hypothetical protein